MPSEWPRDTVRGVGQTGISSLVWMNFLEKIFSCTDFKEIFVKLYQCFTLNSPLSLRKHI